MQSLLEQLQVEQHVFPHSNELENHNFLTLQLTKKDAMYFLHLTKTWGLLCIRPTMKTMRMKSNYK